MKGLKVLVTRPRSQAAELESELERLGAKPISLPAIEITPLEDPSSLKQALDGLVGYDWIVFTSVNGVTAVAEYLKKVPNTVRIAAIGPATATAVREHFREPDVVPNEFLSEAIAPALGDVKGKRVLLARADIARKELARALERMGAFVIDVAAYRIVQAKGGRLSEKPDVITATSSSSAINTFRNLNDLGHEDWALNAPWICIGPVTAETVNELGCTVGGVAKEYTMLGLVEALKEFALGGSPV